MTVCTSRTLVFVDPLDETEEDAIWWPAMIVPRDEIDDSMHCPDKSSIFVRYFEDNSFSVCLEKDLSPFNAKSPLYQTFALRPRFQQAPGMRAALQYLQNSQLPSGFRWKLWGTTRLPPVEVFTSSSAALLSKNTPAIPEDAEAPIIYRRESKAEIKWNSNLSIANALTETRRRGASAGSRSSSLPDITLTGPKITPAAQPKPKVSPKKIPKVDSPKKATEKRSAPAVKQTPLSQTSIIHSSPEVEMSPESTNEPKPEPQSPETAQRNFEAIQSTRKSFEEELIDLQRRYQSLTTQMKNVDRSLAMRKSQERSSRTPSLSQTSRRVRAIKSNRSNTPDIATRNLSALKNPRHNRRRNSVIPALGIQTDAIVYPSVPLEMTVVPPHTPLDVRSYWDDPHDLKVRAADDGNLQMVSQMSKDVDID